MLCVPKNVPLGKAARRCRHRLLLAPSGPRPHPRALYEAQLTAVNTAGDESIAPPLCGAAVEGPCATAASVPQAVVPWCGYSESELALCTRLLLAFTTGVGGLVALGLCLCLWRLMRVRRGHRTAAPAAAARSSRQEQALPQAPPPQAPPHAPPHARPDGGALPAAQSLPPPVPGSPQRASRGRRLPWSVVGAGGSRRLPMGLKRVTQPIWRVFAASTHGNTPPAKMHTTATAARQGGEAWCGESAEPTVPARPMCVASLELWQEITPPASSSSLWRSSSQPSSSASSSISALPPSSMSSGIPGAAATTSIACMGVAGVDAS